MIGGWERRRILVWGKTRPEISGKYKETVCTGGIFADTGRLVRLYPIPLRYLDDEKYFKKYQWIEADVARASDHDRRPESYRIKPHDITVGEQISTAHEWAERAKWVLRPENQVQSVEELQAREAADHTSLGLLKPKKIIQVHVDRFPSKERNTFWTRYNAIVAQMELDLGEDHEEPKPLTPPDYKFFLRFKCDDTRCEGVHKFGILDWEIDALYFNMKQKHGEHLAVKKVVQSLEERTRDDHDTRFFLGNISTHPRNFTIVGLWYPKKSKPRPPTLFDETPA